CKGHMDSIWSAVFSPDGTLILTGSHDKTARLWDAQTGKQKAVLAGHEERVMSVAFSPDGKRVLTAGRRGHPARPGGLGKGLEEAVLKGHPDALSGAYSPDGKRILAGDMLWDAETGQEKAVLQGHARPVVSIGFSPDGKHVLTGSGDPDGPQGTEEVKVWDAE